MDIQGVDEAGICKPAGKAVKNALIMEEDRTGMGTSEKNRQEEEQKQEQQGAGKRSLNGTYDDFFNNKVAEGGDTVLSFGESSGADEKESGKADDSGRKAGGAGTQRARGRELQQSLSGRVDALAEKGREVTEALSSRADALLEKQRAKAPTRRDGAGALPEKQRGGSTQHRGGAGPVSGGRKDNPLQFGDGAQSGDDADALIRRQQELSSQLQGRTDALRRANDALKEVQSLLDNPLYNGMPNLTGGGSNSSGGGTGGTGPQSGPGGIDPAAGLPEVDPSLMAGSAGDLFTGFAGSAGGANGSGRTGAVPGGIGAGGAGAGAVQTAAQQAAAQEAEKPQEPETDPMEELDKLIGLTKIKHDVKELTDFVKIQKMRKEGGLKSVPVSLHLVFTGNPGTGKTTVARILAKLYKQIGVLSKGQLIEVDRSGLVAGYVGQTALKTAKKIEEAKGGVLFIDEAYALARKDDTFGQEAIDTILKAMEDSREDFVVIVAGYTGPMETFINSNPGLKSRFNKYIEFPDYTIDELMGIFDMNCRKYDYEAAEDVREQIRAMIVQRKLATLENFANAREVRNLFEEFITNQARRVAAMENPSKEDMKKILLEDLVETAEEDAAKTLKKAAEAEKASRPAAEAAKGPEEEKASGNGGGKSGTAAGDGTPEAAEDAPKPGA